jgi:hypothetical protein
MKKKKIKWFRIIKYIVIVMFMYGMVEMIMIRKIKKEIERYNKID